MKLYHFTCDHALRKIGTDGGILVPHVDFVVGVGVVWMTHDPHASREALGLSSHTLACDRMFARFEIPDPEDAVPWSAIRSNYRHARILEGTKGTRPDLWWLSRLPQRTARPTILVPVAEDAS